ncbi:siderophore synthetase component [Pedobacter cryoconitis]|uniref:Siderophore synthetase component n=1 Tax=Pedobacter cryoconitis TaxID=188932 RepID=A0A7W9DL66_9SPHI|nr:siderophore synthetase component [Pedobacter cryoconitis]
MKNCLSDHYLQSISLVNTGTGEIFHNGLGFKFLELPKFGKKEDELETDLDKWVYLYTTRFYNGKRTISTVLGMQNGREEKKGWKRG